MNELSLLFGLSAIFLLNITIVAMLSQSAASRKALGETRQEWAMERERLFQSWNAERERLLDRIQAPSFAELKTAEIKVIKAQQGQKEPTPLEPV